MGKQGRARVQRRQQPPQQQQHLPQPQLHELAQKPERPLSLDRRALRSQLD